jgi:hypothetical protein
MNELGEEAKQLRTAWDAVASRQRKSDDGLRL